MRLLVGIDGSKYSAAAVEHCMKCSWSKETVIELFTVIDVGATFFDKKNVSDFRQEAESVLGKEAERLAKAHPDIEIRTIVKEGSAKELILEECRGRDIDLVVLGTHGRTAISRLLMGSVSQGVLNNASCSVRIVRNIDDSFDGPVLIAMDTTTASRAMIERLASYQWSPTEKFVIASIVPTFALQASIDPSGSFATYLPQIIEQARKEAKAATEFATKTLKDKLKEPSFEIEMPSGDAREQIFRIAEDSHCSMILLGSHNRNILDRAIIGSVSEGVALHANCTVEIVR